jgi:hypothetical protein
VTEGLQENVRRPAALRGEMRMTGRRLCAQIRLLWALVSSGSENADERGVAQAHTHAHFGIFHRGLMATMIAELACIVSL